jgi:hypothetical protein
MKKIRLILILLLNYFLFWNQSIAQVSFEYHPKGTMSLGSCFNIKEPLVRRRSAIKFTNKPPDKRSNIQFRTYGIQKSSDLAHALGIDVHVEASSLSYNGSADFGYNVSSESRESSLTVVFGATIEYAPKILEEDYQLTAEAKQVADKLESNPTLSPEIFTNQFGTHFVVEEKRGASLAIIVTINNITEASKKSIASSANGEGGFGFGSLQASAAFLSQVRRANESKDLNININVRGLKDNAQVRDFLIQIAKSEKNLDTLQVYMATLLGKLNDTTSVPTEYLVAPLSNLVPRLNEINDLGYIHKQARLVELVDEYKKIRRREYVITEIVNGRDARAKTLTPSGKEALKLARGKYRKYTDTLAKIHAEYMQAQKGNCCNIPNMPDLPDGSEIPINSKWVIQFYSNAQIIDAGGAAHMWAAGLRLFPHYDINTENNLNLTNTSVYKIDRYYYLLKDDNVNVVKTREEVESEMKRIFEDPKANGIHMKVIDLYELCSNDLVQDVLDVSGKAITMFKCP